MMEEPENDFRFHLRPNFCQSYTFFPEFFNVHVFSAIYEGLRNEEMCHMNYNIRKLYSNY